MHIKFCVLYFRNLFLIKKKTNDVNSSSNQKSKDYVFCGIFFLNNIKISFYSKISYFAETVNSKFILIF